MSNSRRPGVGSALRRGARALTVLVSVTALTGCAGALDPAGPPAQRTLDLIILATVVGSAVALIVLGLMAYALFHRRREDRESRLERDGGTRFVAIGGLIVPSVILFAMMVTTFLSLAQEPDADGLQVQVTGHQFWWEVHYPDYDLTTANEIHIPTGTEIEFQLETDDVLHSFWVPELQGKVDMVPGRINTLVVQADEPGTYRGQCAEFCGLQHANMAFLVIAEPPDEFESWARAQAAPAVVQDTRGEELFERHACAGCHTVRGTSADGLLGPDLTHLASRRTLGAVTIPNTHGHLSGWVVNSQTVKPGNEMPPITTLSPDELHELIAYLESLE